MFELEEDPPILFVEGHAALRKEIERALTAAGFSLISVASVAEARSIEPGRYGARIVDLDTPDAAQWLASDPRREFQTLVLVPAWGESVRVAASLDSSVERLMKPFAVETLEERLIRATSPVRQNAWRDPLLTTVDPSVEDLFDRARRFAKTGLSLVVEGERGTGRRALARALHRESSRSMGACITVDLTHSTRTSQAEAIELIFDRALQGSMILIEPGQWPREVQTQWLRCLALRPEISLPRFFTVSVDSLEEAATAGALLTELFYRLEAQTLRMPALRDRPLDHRALCQSTLRRLAREMGESTPELPDDLLREIVASGFVGNQPALENRLRRALILHEGLSVPGVSSETGWVRPSGAMGGASTLNLKSLERETIVRALSLRDGNRTHASADLGISVRTLRNKIRDYGVR